MTLGGQNRAETVLAAAGKCPPQPEQLSNDHPPGCWSIGSVFGFAIAGFAVWSIAQDSDMNYQRQPLGVSSRSSRLWAVRNPRARTVCIAPLHTRSRRWPSPGTSGCTTDSRPNGLDLGP